MESDRLALRIPEVAERIGVSKAFAYALVQRGELPSVHIGTRVVVPLRALEAWLGARTTEAR